MQQPQSESTSAQGAASAQPRVQLAACKLKSFGARGTHIVHVAERARFRASRLSDPPLLQELSQTVTTACYLNITRD